jgi:hypothetical protein
MAGKILITFAAALLLRGNCFGFTVQETNNYLFAIDAYLRTDLVSWKNVASLDSHNPNDHTTYFGIDYSLGFNLNFKENGPQFYLKLERNGPYDYDAPLFIHNTLMVQGDSSIEPFRNTELLPQAEEFWFDLPVFVTPLRFKAGLFPYDVGKGFASGTNGYENYGFSLYRPGETFSWRFHYFRPDLVYKTKLGPTIRQEKEQGINYEPNAANYFAFDTTWSSEKNTFQPFVSLLLDHTSAGKRYNLFSAQTSNETLGTLGLDYDLALENFSFGFEAARNFGSAESESPDYKDVEHKGYLLYAVSSYKIDKFIPHCRFLYSSGNKVTTEMVDNGLTEFPNGSNKAFSVYSPLNNNFFDSLGPSQDALPLVFFGWGYGLNYGPGLYRPSTLADDAVIENMVMPSLGFDYNFSDKFSVTLDWWYLLANEKGVGMLGGRAKELSRNLGQELDLSFSYELSKNINVSLYTGYFRPGKYFKEERDDTDGSLFTPFVRGDGHANSAYQIELVTEFEF